MLKLLIKGAAVIILAFSHIAASAQANDWILPPATRIDFSSGSASVSTLPGTSTYSGCGNTTDGYNSRYNAVISGYLFQERAASDGSSCGTFNLLGKKIAKQGYNNVFPVPGVCNQLYALCYERKVPSYALMLRKLDISNADTIICVDSIQVVYPVGDLYQFTSIAIAPIANTASRKIYIYHNDSIRSITIGANGAVGQLITHFKAPFTQGSTLSNYVRMEVTPDGKKLLAADAAGTAWLINLANGTAIALTNSLPTVQGQGSYKAIYGYEYVPMPGGDDRVYFSYISRNANQDITGGFYYVSLNALNNPTHITATSLPNNTSQIGWGFSEIERGKDNKLYIAVNHNPGPYSNGSYGVTSGGSLYALKIADNTLAPVLNGSTPVKCYSFAPISYGNYGSGPGVGGYRIQHQIDGETLYTGYSLTTNNVKFSLNGITPTNNNIPLVEICPGDFIKLLTNVTANFSGYKIKLRKGTISPNGSTFTASDNGVTSALINSANPTEVINLEQLFSSYINNSYSGGLEINFTAYNGCVGRSVTQTYKIQRATVLAEYKARWKDGFSMGKEAWQTPNIPDPMPTGNTLQEFQQPIGNARGWQGARNLGIFGVNTDFIYTLKVYEVDAAGNRKIIGNDVAPDACRFTSNGPVTNGEAEFNDNTLTFKSDGNPNYYYDVNNIDYENEVDYFRQYYLFAKANGTLDQFNQKIWCVDFTVQTPAGCTVTKKSYFRIATTTASWGANAKPGRDNDGDEGLSGLTTSIEELLNESDNVNIYPNPAGNMLFVALRDGQSLFAGNNLRARVSDISGRNVLSQDFINNGAAQQIDISRLTPGLYFLELGDAQKNVKMKFVKQ